LGRGRTTTDSTDGSVIINGHAAEIEQRGLSAIHYNCTVATPTAASANVLLLSVAAAAAATRARAVQCAAGARLSQASPAS